MRFSKHHEDARLAEVRVDSALAEQTEDGVRLTLRAVRILIERLSAGEEEFEADATLPFLCWWHYPPQRNAYSALPPAESAP